MVRKRGGNGSEAGGVGKGARCDMTLIKRERRRGGEDRTGDPRRPGPRET